MTDNKLWGIVYVPGVNNTICGKSDDQALVHEARQSLLDLRCWGCGGVNCEEAPSEVKEELSMEVGIFCRDCQATLSVHTHSTKEPRLAVTVLPSSPLLESAVAYIIPGR